MLGSTASLADDGKPALKHHQEATGIGSQDVC